MGDNQGKPWLIPHEVFWVAWPGDESSCEGASAEELAAYQLAGGVTAYQGYDA